MHRKNDLFLKNQSTIETVLTADGTVTLYLPDKDETYHSINGALTESLHVFIDAGLKPIAHQQSSISILEIGFGTGLNALLSWQFARSHRVKIHYCSSEKFPLNESIFSVLHYGEKVAMEDEFKQLHTCQWNETVKLDEYFSLEKIDQGIEEIIGIENADLVFYDAFAPRVQPELWTISIFEKIYSLMKTGGVLVTYCAKGEVKRNLKAAGFTVETLPGPPGKREMTRARK